jgi:hypothetical protein
MPRIPPLAEVLPIELTAHTTPKWPECTAARAKIESARIRARKEFLEAMHQSLPKDLPQNQWPNDRVLFRNYVVTVWFALNHELCELGRRRKWQHKLQADHIRQRSEEFLEGFTTLIAYPEDGRDRFGRPLEGVIEGYVRLSRRFQELIQQHELWDEGQAELLAVSDQQGGKRKNRTVRQLAAIEKTARPQSAGISSGSAVLAPGPSRILRKRRTLTKGTSLAIPAVAKTPVLPLSSAMRRSSRRNWDTQ